MPPMVNALTGLCLWNGDDPDAVGHHDVLALADDSKASRLQGPHGILMIDVGDLGHVLRGDLDFAHHRAL